MDRVQKKERKEKKGGRLFRVETAYIYTYRDLNRQQHPEIMIAGTTVKILRLQGRFGERELPCKTRVINCRPLFRDAIKVSFTQLYSKVNTCKWLFHLCGMNS